MKVQCQLFLLLFSGGGVGDAGIEWGAGIPVIAACEIVPSRANLIKLNF